MGYGPQECLACRHRRRIREDGDLSGEENSLLNCLRQQGLADAKSLNLDYSRTTAGLTLEWLLNMREHTRKDRETINELQARLDVINEAATNWVKKYALHQTR